MGIHFCDSVYKNKSFDRFFVFLLLWNWHELDDFWIFRWFVEIVIQKVLKTAFFCDFFFLFIWILHHPKLDTQNSHVSHMENKNPQWYFLRTFVSYHSNIFISQSSIHIECVCVCINCNLIHLIWFARVNHKSPPTHNHIFRFHLLCGRWWYSIEYFETKQTNIQMPHITCVMSTILNTLKTHDLTECKWFISSIIAPITYIFFFIWFSPCLHLIFCYFYSYSLSLPALTLLSLSFQFKVEVSPFFSLFLL